MIIFKSTTNKMHIYKCDRCGARLETPIETVYGIYVRSTKNPKKKWDLCKKCYGSLCRGIEKNNK